MLLFRPARASAGAELLFIAVAAVLWGAGGVVVAALHDATGLPAGSIAFYRLALAALVLLAVSRPGRLVAAFRAAPVALAVAGVGLAVYQALYFVAVTAAGVGIATVVSIGIAPVLLAGWEAVAARRIPGRRTIVTIATGVAGLILVTFGGEASGAGPRPLWGIAAATASGTVYAATTVVSRRTTASIAALPMTTVTTTVGALALTPLALAGGIAFTPDPAAITALALLGPVTTALAYALFYRGLRGTAASRAALVVLVEPLAAALLAVALLGEPLAAGTVAGGVLLLGSVAYSGGSPTSSASRARWRSAVPRARASARARLR